MKGTPLQKIVRLGAHLLAHPHFLPRYLAHNWFQRATPLDLELPWFAYGAIDFLDHFLCRGMSVCEYGTGGSTLFFARRVSAVCSIEDNPVWFHLLSERLRQKQLMNVQILFHPFDFKNPAGFDHSGYLCAIPPRSFDVLVVDGSEEWTPVRPVCFREAERRVAKGGLIVVDDSWRYPALRRENRAKSYRVFQSVGPGRPGVTSTDIYFY